MRTISSPGTPGRLVAPGLGIDHAELEAVARTARGLAGLLVGGVELGHGDVGADLGDAVGGDVAERGQDGANGSADGHRAGHAQAKMPVRSVDRSRGRASCASASALKCVSKPWSWVPPSRSTRSSVSSASKASVSTWRWPPSSVLIGPSM